MWGMLNEQIQGKRSIILVRIENKSVLPMRYSTKNVKLAVDVPASKVRSGV